MKVALGYGPEGGGDGEARGHPGKATEAGRRASAEARDQTVPADLRSRKEACMVGRERSRR